MSSLVLLRWVVRPDRRHRSPRAVIDGLISPSVRAAGWLSSPGTTHHVSDRGGEAWLTVVTPVDDATEVRDELSELLAAPAIETSTDVLLDPDAEWYRAALQEVSHVGLDVLQVRSALPLSEYEAFETPGDAALRLVPFLNAASDTYRRASSTYQSTGRFWLDFFRRPPTPDLPRSGHALWNLAG